MNCLSSPSGPVNDQPISRDIRANSAAAAASADLCWRSSSAPEETCCPFQDLGDPLEFSVLASSSAIPTTSLVDTAGARPSSMSACRTHDRTDSVP